MFHIDAMNALLSVLSRPRMCRRRYLEPIAWNHAAGFALIAAGAFFVFHKW
jgi:hypothetical protein